MGLAISGFRTRIRVSKATTPSVSGPDSERARRYLERLQVLLSLDGAHRVEIAEAIPDHAGLGSGTQLALALAAAIRRLHHAGVVGIAANDVDRYCRHACERPGRNSTNAGPAQCLSRLTGGQARSQELSKMRAGTNLMRQSPETSTCSPMAIGWM